jgi:RNA-binding protein
MYEFPLTGAQKSFLRGVGQTLEAGLKVGRGGLTPEFFAELQKLLRAHELVKLRFLGAERDERAALCTQIADEGRCVFISAVGHTALFYRQHPEPKQRSIALPEAKAE